MRCVLALALLTLCVGGAVLPPIYLEAEYFTTAGNWYASSSSSDWDSCGQYITTSTYSGSPAKWSVNITTAGTYAIWFLSRCAQPGGADLWVQFDSATALSWDIFIFGNSWRLVPTTATLTAGIHTLSLTMRYYVSNVYIDKILITDPTFPQLSYSYKGKSAQNIPSGKCQQMYLEAEYAAVAASPMTIVPSVKASMEGAVYRAEAASTSCSTSARYIRFDVTWSESIYRPVWVRVLAPTSSYNQLGLYSSSCSSLASTLSATASQEYQWIPFSSLVVVPNSFIITLITGYTYLDRIYVGWGVPSDSASPSFVPTTTTSGCSYANGLCDPVTTCSAAYTCTSCPTGYSGCGDIRTCNAPNGCVRTVPFGCYFDRSQAQWGQTNSMTWPSGSVTVEMWAAPTLYFNAEVTVIDYMSTSTSQEFNIRYNPTYGLYLYTSTVSLRPATAIFLKADMWTHIAVSYDLATAKFYINGVLTATVTGTASVVASPGKLALGKKVVTDVTTDTTLPSFAIDELRIWNTILDATAIQSRMSATLTTNVAGLFHLFSFGPDSGACSPLTMETFGSTYMDIGPTELQALYNLYWSTGGLDWYSQTSWLNGKPCSGSTPLWYGVDCDSNGRIITLNLAYNNLVGSLPPSMFAPFSKLSILMLDHNSLSGSIPIDIGYLTSAVTILMQSNSLTNIPTTIGKLSVLSKLYLQDNKIAGTIPDIFSAMTSLTYLYAQNNILTGSIPASISASTSIKYLDLSYNQLSGSLSYALVNSKISYVDLSGNDFTGQMPNRDTTVNTNMIQFNFTSSYFTCKVPPFMRSSSLTFTVDVTGSVFFCPINDVVTVVQGIACETVTMFSVTPNSYNLNNPFTTHPTATINATGLHSCTGIYVFVSGVGLVAPTSLTDSLLTFEIPAHGYGIVPLKLMWIGAYSNNTVVSSNSLDFKYYYPCPATCVSPYGVCAGLSGVCRCNGSRGGPDCHQLSCPANCNGRGDCNYTTGTCKCWSPYFGKSCSAALIDCPKNCSGHGQCDIFTGVCSCYLGYWGSDCSNKTCPPQNIPYCNKHGVCNGTTGKCKCDSGWIGDSCNTPVKACPGDCTNANQGQCDQATGVCTCFTYMGLKYGGSDCSSVICDPSCLHGGTCNTSSSTCICTSTYRGSDCSTPHFDCPNNCSGSSHGDCDYSSGNCSCRSGLVGSDCSVYVCPGTPECSYPQGVCNTTKGVCECADNGTAYYTGYMCQYQQFYCPGTPVCSGNGYCNPNTGKCMCNYPWVVDDVCSAARCPNDCWGHGDCNTATGVCACWAAYNTSVDCQFLYIACPSSCNHGYCDTRTGTCVCYSPWANNGTDLCAIQLCPEDCNSGLTGDCVNGTCICDAGWAGTSCTIPNKTCAGTCNTPNGRCDTTTGNCTCYGSFYGDNCQYKYCLENCSHHGSCNVVSGVCTCDSGWEPPDCYVNLCASHDFCTSSVRGLCDTSVGSCICTNPYYGDSCQYKLCSLNCSGHGACNNASGSCVCDQDWIGTGCEVFSAMCPPSRENGCNGNGLCNHTTGDCTCYVGYFGTDCRNMLCPNNCSGHGTCDYLTGDCTCDTNYTDPYDVTCSTPYYSCLDLNCSGNGYCNTLQGKCYCYYGYYGDKCQYKYCPDKCDLHGVCNTTTGLCHCAEYYDGLSCLEPIRPCLNNCTGAHGHCDPTTGNCTCYSPWQLPDCKLATCTLNCSYPHGTCDQTTGVCKCLSTYAGKGCQIANFTCSPPCEHGNCDVTTGKCVCYGGYYGDTCNLMQCPGLTPCSSRGTCNSTTGACTCTANYTGTACEAPNYLCPNNCTGTHGHCDSTVGQCACFSPWLLPQCLYASCTLNCSWPHGTCDKFTGNCKCTTNYTGKGCQIANFSCPACVHGSCDTTTGKCVCQGGYYGDTCKYKQCQGKTPCSSHGKCDNTTGTCDCDDHYSGDACEVPYFACPKNCTNATAGLCNTQKGECLCKYPFYGTDCSYVKCPSNCRGHGKCNNRTGVCTCDAYYLPPDCYFKSCPLNCSKHGTCNPFNGKCTCSPIDEWGGVNCSQRLCPYSCSNSGKCQDNGKCNCKIGATGSGCQKSNWWIIVVCAGGGCVVLVGGCAGGFLAIRQFRIKQAEARRKKNTSSYVDMDVKH